jgi:hypothetical protein
MLPLILYLAISFSSCMPVFDELNFLLNRLIQEVQERILKDTQVVLKDIKSLDEARYIAFLVSQYGLTGGEIKALTPPDITEILRRGSYIVDKLKRDTWARIWQRVESIFYRYRVLKDFSYITDNPLYRHNPQVRSFIDKNLEREAEKLKNYENILDLCATLREIEAERLDLIQKWERYIKEYAVIKDESTGAASTGKLLSLLTFIKIEALKSDMQYNILARIEMENYVKDNIHEIDLFKRFMKRVNESHKENRGWR